MGIPRKSSLKPSKPLHGGFIKSGGKIALKPILRLRKRRKRGELTILKEKLWGVTRLLVFKTYGSDCYTCPNKNLEGANRQGGHMPWHSSELSVACRYDIRFIRAQCWNCNLRKGGKGGTANQRMRHEGIDVDALERLNEETKGRQYPTQWFRDKIAEYQKLLVSSEHI